MKSLLQSSTSKTLPLILNNASKQMLMRNNAVDQLLNKLQTLDLSLQCSLTFQGIAYQAESTLHLAI